MDNKHRKATKANNYWSETSRAQRQKGRNVPVHERRTQRPSLHEFVECKASTESFNL